MTYAEQLRDPRWQELRLRIMDRDGFRCFHCESNERTLHVHHIFYKKAAKAWEYEPENLITLCERCHGRIENYLDLARLSLSLPLPLHGIMHAVGDFISVCENADQGNVEPIIIERAFARLAYCMHSIKEETLKNISKPGASMPGKQDAV